MQNYKDKFTQQDKTKFGTLQSCIRTNDLDLVGDGSHLTYFEMLGNFSFGRNDYEESIQLWHEIVMDFKIPITHINYYPTRIDHKKSWESLGYLTKPDETCQWSDGEIGGDCCEMFIGDLEVGNLVNTLGHSTDVGFGYERLLQIYEKKKRVDETSLFDQTLDPISRDHKRILDVLWENNVEPGAKGRNSICRKLIRRFIENTPRKDVSFFPWVEQEIIILEKKERLFRQHWKKYKKMPFSWWYETLGITINEFNTFKEKY